MRKLVCSIIIAAMLLHTITAIAGDIPEGLLYEDQAEIFFGEMVSYDSTENKMTILPTEKIKGGVTTGMPQDYHDVSFIGKSDLTLTEGEIYLFASYDEHNPLYVFRINSTDTATTKIKGISGQAMWERFQLYLNEGAYGQKEAERLAKAEEQIGELLEEAEAPQPAAEETPQANIALASTSTKILEPDASSFLLIIVGGFVIGIAAGMYFRNRKKS